jgi:hypothetical protein
MSSVVVIADWIKRVAEDEHRRDAIRLAEQEEVDRKDDLVRLHGPRLVGELEAAIRRDVDSFRNEFPDDRARNIVVDATTSGGGFVVRRPAAPPVSLSLEPHFEAATLVCWYRFASADGLPPRDDRFELAFAGDEGGVLQMKHQATWRVFPTADALSEYLLGPVFTGRPR